MSDQPLFRVIGPDGEEHYGFSIDCDGRIEGYCSADDMSGWSVEYLRDPRPCAAEVQAVVEAVSVFRGWLDWLRREGHTLTGSDAADLVREAGALADAFDRAKAAVAPIIEREREGEDVGAVMDLRLD